MITSASHMEWHRNWRTLTNEIGRLLKERENLYALGVERGIIRGEDMPQSGAQFLCDALADRLGIPRQALPLTTRPRDETGFWTSVEVVALVVETLGLCHKAVL